MSKQSSAIKRRVKPEHCTNCLQFSPGNYNVNFHYPPNFHQEEIHCFGINTFEFTVAPKLSNHRIIHDTGTNKAIGFSQMFQFRLNTSVWSEETTELDKTSFAHRLCKTQKSSESTDIKLHLDLMPTELALAQVSPEICLDGISH